MSKYNLCVGAMFKNEEKGLKEWMEHYIFHGVDHFYLINDGSTDTSVQVLQPYLNRGLVTLFTVAEPYYLGRQRNLYNRHILPLLGETHWLLMIDIDEYVWSRMNVNLARTLDLFHNFGQVQIQETLFGSNGLVQQPEKLVPAFTRCKTYEQGESRKLKYFVNSHYEFTSLNIHHADFADKKYVTDASKFIIGISTYFNMNHYNCQSIEFWNGVKCTRGDSDHYIVRTPEQFKQYDINDVENLELLEQNRSLYG